MEIHTENVLILDTAPAHSYNLAAQPFFMCVLIKSL